MAAAYDAPTTTAADSGESRPRVVIIGAGLTTAYQLMKAGCPSTVLESDSVVGGISRTVERDGRRFDIGGQRFSGR